MIENMNKITAFILITYIMIFSTMLYAFFKNSFISNRKNYEIFRTNLFNGFKSGKILSTEDIQFVFRYSNKLGFYNGKFKIYLEKIIGEEITSSEKNIPDDMVVIIKNYIKELETKLPFDKLPETEKVICNDIISFIDSKEWINAKEKLYSLSDAIYLREESLQKVKKTNQWSIPIAVIGIVLTIVFGVISIIK